MNYFNEYSYTKNTNFDLVTYSNFRFTINDKIVNNNRAIHNDIVYYDNDTIIGIKSRNMCKIAGILYLNKNTKYGFNSKHMPYYQFLPLNKKYPKFLVASSLKKKSKQYIVITFSKWPVESKYPYGKCEHVIGDTNVCNNMYEILLYKHNLIYPRLKIDKNIIEQHKTDIISNIDYNVFTIDPAGCKDIDDALSINKYDTYVEVGIHITNVSHYINDIYYLLYNLVSSIYASHRQINMLPDVYANDICSLLENTNRRCISVILKFSHNYELLNYNIKLTKVHIIKNFSYDEAENIIKTNKKQYQYLFNLWDFMSTYNKQITDTHILVEKLMILANHKVAETLYNYDKQNTLLRVHNISNNIDNNLSDNINNNLSDNINNNLSDNIDNNLSDNIEINHKKLSSFLKLKTFNSATYQNNVIKPNHYGLKLNLYTHFTSPIRRLCDIITHINIKNYIKKKPLLELSENNIKHINDVNKRIKKLYYDYKIIDLIDRYKNQEMLYCMGYIIEFSHKYFIIYIPKYDIEYKIKYYSNKLDNLYIILKSDTYLEIKYEAIIKKYNLYDSVDLELYFIENMDKLEDKIKIKIL